jgi:cellulose synthase/poly-beta-1,6-N-acetylglucosamine synthase-like glycosyltransferase
VASLFAFPVAVFVVEILAALMLPSRTLAGSYPKDDRARVAVLVPAHDESQGILPTLQDLKEQLRGGKILVVADNCSDGTAAVAAAAGVEVIERNDPQRPGKGYALAFGLEHLRADPPDIVIVIDADCRVATGTISQLVKSCLMQRRPAQAVDLMTAPDNSSINYRVAEFAWRVKNWVRPLGLSNLNLPCQLMGTGMAFPWELISSVDLATGSVVEDLKLGLDLSSVGYSPVFCLSAKVISHFPSSSTGAQTQRERWEKGHVRTILSKAPALVYQSLIQGNTELLALTLDLIIPPLSLFSILLVSMCLVSGLAVLFGTSSTAFLISAASLIAFAAAIFVCWLYYGRDILPLRATPLIASYIVGKIAIYKSFSKSANTRWIRADRTKRE